MRSREKERLREAANRRDKIILKRQRELLRVFCKKVDRARLRESIEMSISEETRERAKTEIREYLENKRVETRAEEGRKEGRSGGRRKRTQLKVRRRGGVKLITRRDGSSWLLPQDKEEELTWRRELRRRKQLARWESPSPGPPRGGGPKWGSTRRTYKGKKALRRGDGDIPPATATRRSQLQRRTEEQRCGDGCSP